MVRRAELGEAHPTKSSMESIVTDRWMMVNELEFNLSTSNTHGGQFLLQTAFFILLQVPF